MVCPDLNLVLSTLKMVSPLLQTAYDCQELLIVDIVITLDVRQTLLEEGNGVPLVVLLRELQ